MAKNLINPLKDTIKSTVTSSVSTVTGNIAGSLANVSKSNISASLLGTTASNLAGNLLNGNGLSNLAGDLLNGNGIGNLAGNLLNGNGLSNLAGGNLNDIINQATELKGIINNPLKIVEKGEAELIGLAGETFAPLQQQFNQLIGRTSFGDFVDETFKSPFDQSKNSYSRIPNPLRNYNGFNYKITLGILGADEYNNPKKYRESGFKNYIIRSGGGDLGKRYQVFDETAGSGGHAEYYIEDLEFESVVAPNPNTRVTLGTSMTFNVIEPYSMSNFIQAIIGSAREAGYKNYLSAPFCLRIDFLGWNEYGTAAEPVTPEPIFLPIKIINMDFNVTGQGSVYTVSAVPMSETGLADNINKIQVPIKTTGTLVHELLETNDVSVTSTINGQLQALEESGALSPYDRYIIAFPNPGVSLSDVLDTGTVDESAFTTTAQENIQQQKGSTAPLEGATYAADQTIPNIVVKPVTKTYSILKSFSENTSLMNEIGLSPFNVDSNAGGNETEAAHSAVIDPRTNKVDVSATAAQSSEKAREQQFGQGEKITDIIEKIVMQSEYAALQATKGATAGLNKWFRIATQVFIDESPVTEAQLGRKPRVYVYSVIPYEVGESATLGVGEKPGNIQGLKQSAAKEYNYIYTGKNEDVLNFDINFNNAFALTALTNFNMNAAPIADLDSSKTNQSQADAATGVTTAIQSGSGSNNDASGEIAFNNKTKLSPGSTSKDPRRQIAEMFHERITEIPVDMVTAEMEIFGDPFFIPQQIGNFGSTPADKPNTSKEGTMRYLDSQVFVDFNFMTPFDYQVSGATMEFPQVVPQFSGLYSVWAVINSLSGGHFKQKLKLIRQRGQDDEPSGSNSNFVQLNNSVSTIAKSVTVSDGTVGRPDTSNIKFNLDNLQDDVRNLLPAIDNKIAADLAAPFAEIESKLAGAQNVIDSIGSIGIEGVDFGLASVPDLSKVIPKITGGSISDIAGNALGGALDSAVGNALGNVTGALDQVADLKSQANNALSNVSGAVNTVANQSIASVTGAAKAKAKNLLG